MVSKDRALLSFPRFLHQSHVSNPDQPPYGSNKKQAAHHKRSLTHTASALPSSLPTNAPRNNKKKTSKTAPTNVIILVGPRQQRFKVNRHMLCSTSPFFDDLLNTTNQAAPSQEEDEQKSPSKRPRSITLWLPAESPSMFAFFVQWVNSPHTFRWFLDDVINTSNSESTKALRDTQWDLVKLHLFASHLELHQLQDMAMDAIQDLYLQCGWTVDPILINYLYGECDPLYSVRLRRWAVATLVFSVASSFTNLAQSSSKRPSSSVIFARLTTDPTFGKLITSISDLSMDLRMHLAKMSHSGLDVRCKNPQLRVPANKLEHDERTYKFRECSFHSHRAAVGENRCPHSGIGTSVIDMDGSSTAGISHAGTATIRAADGITGLTAPRKPQSPEPQVFELDANTMIPHIAVQVQLAKPVVVEEKVVEKQEQQQQMERTLTLTSLGRRSRLTLDVEAPWTLFSRGRDGEGKPDEQALRHMRSISSVLR